MNALVTYIKSILTPVRQDGSKKTKKKHKNHTNSLTENSQRKLNIRRIINHLK